MFSRTKMLIGDDNFEKLNKAKVAVVGLGGVGAAAFEALVRAGIGNIILLDNDVINITNLNRQIIATTENIGMSKVEVAAKRALSINPSIKLKPLDFFYNQDTSEQLFIHDPNYIIDAIDTITSKLLLTTTAISRQIEIISCLSTGNRLDGSKFLIGNISETKGSGCPLARVMRNQLKKYNVNKLDVLYSTACASNVVSDVSYGRHSPASISYVPPIAGYLLAQHVIFKIINKTDN